MQGAASAHRSNPTTGGAATYITTSWDDGHPLDLRVAELLTKYRIRGTFYVPRNAEHGTMTTAQIRKLAPAFELGAHTLRHVVLTGATAQDARQEICGSKSWIEDNTGSPCLLFCPPKGRYAARHLEMIRTAGYRGVRSTELVSLDFPRRQAGLLLMPTTLQAHPHGLLVFARNAMKRRAFGNFWRFVVHGRSTEWPELAQSLLRHALARGGVFHLWGHSWELQEAGQWQRLDEVLRFLREFAGQAPSLTNWQVCQRAFLQVAPLQDPEQEVQAIGGR
jgi:peptidoglycan/xylan/chitin deacetylase (PgdA/CDA1 family)